MNGIKRKSDYYDPLPPKKTKFNSNKFRGGAWREELTLIVKERWDIEIYDNICEIIQKYSVGGWNHCITCEGLIDCTLGIEVIKDGKIVLYCEGCYPWKGYGSKEYSFDI